MTLEIGVVYQLVLLLVAGLLAARVGQKFRIPEAITLLLVGYALGVDMLNLLRVEVLGINVDFLALIAVPLILFYDGLRTDLKNIIPMWKTVLSVSTLAVVVTVAGIAAFSHFVLGLSPIGAFLLGAILASTDPAGILPVLQKLNIRKRVATVLEGETAFNDAMAITLFLIALGLSEGTTIGIRSATATFLTFTIASVAVGLVVGIVIRELAKVIGLNRDVTFTSIVVILATYALAELLKISSVIAVVVAAIVFRRYIQSREVDSLHRLHTFDVWDNINFLAVAIIFLVLGSQLQLAAFLPYVGIGLLISLAFVLVIRPLTIFVSMFFDKSFSTREKLLISWLGGPRGSVSAALASIILAKAQTGAFSLPEAQAIFGITLTVIVATVTLASFTASWSVHKLLGIDSSALSGEYRRLAAELKAMMIASRKLREGWQNGVISTSMYDEIDREHRKLMKNLEDRLAEISTESPDIELKARSMKVRQVLLDQMSALNDAYENKELTQDDYEALTEKFVEQIERLDEIENTVENKVKR